MINKISRKSFLKLGAGMMVASVGLSARPVGAEYRSSKSDSFQKSPAKTLIKGADVLTMEKGRPDLFGYDVLLKGGKIGAIEKSISASEAEIIDSTGKVLMPGFTDGFRHNWQSVSSGRLLRTNNSSSRHYYNGYAYQGVCLPGRLHDDY